MEIMISSPIVAWGVAHQTLPGETQSGDLYVVKPFATGLLVAVLDGLGHGPEAAVAAKTAAAIMERFASEHVISLVRRCYEGLRGTRGAVMSLASFNGHDGTMAWVGVGNVQGVLVRADPSAAPACESLLVRAGLVGRQLPYLVASVVAVNPGDTLIFHTDGILHCVGVERKVTGSPQDIADGILKEYKLDTDDALVLVAQYRGDIS